MAKKAVYKDQPRFPLINQYEDALKKNYKTMLQAMTKEIAVTITKLDVNV